MCRKSRKRVTILCCHHHHCHRWLHRPRHDAPRRVWNRRGLHLHPLASFASPCEEMVLESLSVLRRLLSLFGEDACFFLRMPSHVFQISRLLVQESTTPCWAAVDSRCRSSPHFHQGPRSRGQVLGWPATHDFYPFCQYRSPHRTRLSRLQLAPAFRRCHYFARVLPAPRPWKLVD